MLQLQSDATALKKHVGAQSSTGTPGPGRSFAPLYSLSRFLPLLALTLSPFQPLLELGVQDASYRRCRAHPEDHHSVSADNRRMRPPTIPLLQPHVQAAGAAAYRL